MVERYHLLFWLNGDYCAPDGVEFFPLGCRRVCAAPATDESEQND
jgi:hypothetical protein